jgi:hypothetical protein
MLVSFTRESKTIPVGASLLAMDVNDIAGWQVPRSALKSIASKLAPTGTWFSSGKNKPGTQSGFISVPGFNQCRI